MAEADALLVDSVVAGVTDEHVVHAVADSDGTGVDIPLGWPVTFVEFIQQHAKQTLTAPANTARPWRRTLALRATDIDLHRRTGLTPLSVSANLIAYPAFRWAGIEARLRDLNIDVSRDGSGAIAEVYPAAALYRWGIPHTRYKGPKHHEARQAILTAISERFPELDWNGFDALALADDNALDSVIAALVRYQIADGLGEGPLEHLRDVARSEGWIWVPSPHE